MSTRLIEHLPPEAPLHLPLQTALAALPPASRRLLRAVAKQAEQDGLPLYIVGGFVRDVLLGLRSLDLDLVVEGDAIAFGRKLARAQGGSLRAHKPFGTAVWTLEPAAGLPDFVDLISARRETYARPGALPTVQLSTLQDDQYRRDFTINTLALRLDGAQAGELYDPWGGLSDLRRGLVRVLHEGSFSDDPTRMFRALRFVGRLGFQLEGSTSAQLRANLPALRHVSGERLFNELQLILQEPQRSTMLMGLQRRGVLRAVEPGLGFTVSMAAELDAAPLPPRSWELRTDPAELGWVVWLAQLPQESVRRVIYRLRFPRELAEAATAAASLRTQVRGWLGLPASVVTRRLDRVPLLAVYAASLLQHSAQPARLLGQYARTWRTVQPHTDGEALKAHGLKPGPAYSRILGLLRDAWLDGEIKTPKQEQALLERLLREHA
ncbi:MAG: CCA tRNA nucleotidyltransferase [Anaerolineales bacterium]|nr:CCA tRNA nucleotidyltransferase [Anaerolineales bacterium]